MSTYLAVVKMGYVPVANDDDEVIPGNIGALKKGLEALLSEDARDLVRARELWAEAKELLAEESEDETGPAAQGTVQVDDLLHMEQLSEGIF